MDSREMNNNKLTKDGRVMKWTLPWIETYYEKDKYGNVCTLRRRDDPTFVEHFKHRQDMYDRINEMEIAVQFSPKMEVV